jgi:MYXO-CTERM domain-containing protein
MSLRRRLSPLFTLALLGLPSPARAGVEVSGDLLRIDYNDTGTWNDPETAHGLQYQAFPDFWIDFTSYGISYQLLSVAWHDGDGAASAYAVGGTSSGYTTPLSTFTTVTLEDASDSTAARSHWVGTAKNLVFDKVEAWDLDASTAIVTLTITNSGPSDASGLVFLFGVDPDQEYEEGVRTTEDDTLDVDSDGIDDWVESASPRTGLSIGFGACDPQTTELGHYDDWQAETGSDVILADKQGNESDAAMGLRVTLPGVLGPGKTTVAGLVVAVARDSNTARDNYLAAAGYCPSCDADADGFQGPLCSGDDCDDTAASVYPGAVETWYDGVDQDCSGGSDYDQDGDGHDTAASGGDDCDDLDVSIWEDCNGDSAHDTASDDHPGSRDTGRPSGPNVLVLGHGLCGCSSASGGANGGLLWALLALVARRRRQATVTTT